MTTAPPGAELEQTAHARLGAIARVVMTGASIVHDAAAHYVAAHNKALTEQMAEMRAEAAALTFRAYHLGRFHELYRSPLPDDVVAAAAQLDPEAAEGVVDVVRSLTAEYAPVAEVVLADHSAAAAAAAPIGDEHQDHEPAAAAPDLCDHGVPTPVAGLCDHDEVAELGELKHQDHEPAAAAE